MASEISIQVLLSFLKGNLEDDFNFPKTLFTMNGKHYVHRTHAIILTDTTIDVASLVTPGFALFVNRGPRTIVTLKNAAAGTIFPKMKVGEPAMFRFDSSVAAPVAISSTATISAVTNAAAAKMTSAAHLLTTGDIVQITGFTVGWTGANGTFTVTVVDANNFTIPVDSTAFGAISGAPVFTAASLEYLILED